MLLTPNWPTPPSIQSYTTLRFGGFSEPPFDSFNLATHVGDAESMVVKNRNRLKETLKLPNEPIWIDQHHGTTVLEAPATNRDQRADATFSHQPNQVCIVLTADCLPILLCDRDATVVAAIHAGWRGLANGIIEKTLQTLHRDPNTILAWLGPAIGASRYEIGLEVRDAFLRHNPHDTIAFQPSRENHWFADLYCLAKSRLKKSGVNAVYGGEYCTYSAADKFFSYRRDGARTGRMATLIWMSDSSQQQ